MNYEQIQSDLHYATRVKSVQLQLEPVEWVEFTMRIINSSSTPGKYTCRYYN